MMTKAEVRVMWPRAKKYGRPLEAGKARNRFSPRVSRRNAALPTS